MPTPESAADALADAERTRRDFAAGVVLPAGYDYAMGTAIAVQVTTAAVGLTLDGAAAAVTVLGGVALFTVVAAIQLLRFRRANGVWLGGFASKVVLGTATTASLAYAASLFGALAAASQELWWLVGVLAIAGAVGYVISGRQWLHRYRNDPAGYGPGESVMWLISITVFAISGYVLLVING